MTPAAIRDIYKFAVRSWSISISADRFQFTTRSMLVGVAVIGIACGAFTYAARTVNAVLGTVTDAYRVWGTGDLLVDYMNANNQQWPSDWQQLEAFYAASKKTYTIIETFDDIRDNIEIDFGFDPLSVELDHPDDDPPFKAVWLRNGKNSAYVGAGPNEIVYAHLKRHALAMAPVSSVVGEPGDATEPGLQGLSNGELTVPAR